MSINPTPTALPAALAWDMDGTIQDSEETWQQATAQLAGDAWSDTYAQQLRGVGAEVLGTFVHKHAGVGESPAHASTLVEERVVSLLEANPAPFMPGARELLLAAHQAGVRQVLVTASPFMVVPPLLAQLPAGLFEFTITADDVEQTKPDPAPYRTACQRLELNPRNVLALEDSHTGLASAHGAHLVTLGLGDQVKPGSVYLSSPEPHLWLPGLEGVNLKTLTKLWESVSTISSGEIRN